MPPPPTTVLWPRAWVALSSTLVAIGLSAHAVASDFDYCTPSYYPMMKGGSSSNPYVIDYKSFDQHLGINQERALGVITHAAAIWSGQAAGGALVARWREDGAGYSPPLHGECKPDGENDWPSVVRVIDQCHPEPGGLAEHTPHCIKTDGTKRAYRWVINVYTETDHGDGCKPIKWDTTLNGSAGSFDLISVLVHEFGHALGLGEAGVHASVMTWTLPLEPGINRRDLYRYDAECLEYVHQRWEKQFGEVVGRRDLANVHWQEGDSFKNTLGLCGFGHGLEEFNGDWHFTTRQFEFEGFSFWNDPRNSISPRSHGIPGVPYNNARLLDRQHFYYVPFDSETYSNPFFAYFRARAATSDDFFKSVVSDEFLEYCQDSSHVGPEECDGPTLPVRTSRRLATTYDPLGKQSLVAWQLSQRNKHSHHELRIAADSLSKPHILGFAGTFPPLPGNPSEETLRIKTSPGMACSTEATAGDHNCILAFVSEFDDLNRVRIIRFSVTLNQNETFFTFDVEPWSDIYVGNRSTAHDIAAWRHDGSWYVAFADTHAYDFTTVHRSTDGAATWTRVALLQGDAAPATTATFESSRRHVLTTPLMVGKHWCP